MPTANTLGDVSGDSLLFHLYLHSFLHCTMHGRFQEVHHFENSGDKITNSAWLKKLMIRGVQPPKQAHLTIFFNLLFH